MALIDSILTYVAIALVVLTFLSLNELQFLNADDVSKERNANVSIFWNAPFLSGGGYCSEALSIVSALNKRNFDVHIIQHGDSVNQNYISGLSSKEQNFIWDLLNKGSHSRKPTLIEVCHSEPGAWDPAAYKTSKCPMFRRGTSYRIGRTMFETDKIPKGWARKMNSMDEIWVPSEFMKRVFEKGGVRNIHVIGESVDTYFFQPILSIRKESNLSVTEDEANSMNMTRAFLFDEVFEKHPIHGYHSDILLSMFKWEYRKGWDLLLSMYFNTFTIQSNVSLFIVSQEYHEEVPIEQQIKDFIQSHFTEKQQESLPHFKVITTYAPQSYLPYFYNMATAVVLPTRGEGWGRVTQEAMSCGIPVITTGYGGVLTFINKNNSYPISVGNYITIEKGPFKGHQLVEPDMEELVSTVKYVLAHPEERHQIGEQARKDMVENYSEEAFGHVLEQEIWRIESLLEERKRKIEDEL